MSRLRLKDGTEPSSGRARKWVQVPGLQFCGHTASWWKCRHAIFGEQIWPKWAWGPGLERLIEFMQITGSTPNPVFPQSAFKEIKCVLRFSLRSLTQGRWLKALKEFLPRNNACNVHKIHSHFWGNREKQRMLGAGRDLQMASSVVFKSSFLWLCSIMARAKFSSLRY